MNNFLPDNYEIPSSPSNYMKFVDGLNRIRILSSAVVGYEYFRTDNKPVRTKVALKETPMDIKDGGKVKPFWAFVVWNYQTSTIQILELTQKSIMGAILALVNNPKWGDPSCYDIAITKTGEGMETEYNVQGEPPVGEIPLEISESYKIKKINLELLFTSENPFEN